MRRAVAALLLCLLLGAAGCGSDEESAATGDTTSRSSATTSEPPRAPGEPIPVESAAAAAKRTEPKVYVPDDPPPRKVIVEDVIEGKGASAARGDELTVNFIAVRYLNGEFFESSWDWPKPFTFTLDESNVIPGWVQGLPGMKEGGRRHLIIPGRLAARGGISPFQDSGENSLVYVVDLLKVE